MNRPLLPVLAAVVALAAPAAVSAAPAPQKAPEAPPDATVKIRFALEELVARSFARSRQKPLDDQVRSRCDADLRVCEIDFGGSADGDAALEHERPERGGPLEPWFPHVYRHRVIMRPIHRYGMHKRPPFENR